MDSPHHERGQRSPERRPVEITHSGPGSPAAPEQPKQDHRERDQAEEADLDPERQPDVVGIDLRRLAAELEAVTAKSDPEDRAVANHLERRPVNLNPAPDRERDAAQALGHDRNMRHQHRTRNNAGKYHHAPSSDTQYPNNCPPAYPHPPP